jgi:hypothetical protein
VVDIDHFLLHFHANLAYIDIQFKQVICYIVMFL